MAYNNTIPSYHDLRGLSIVWLRAIALAWEYQQPQYKTDSKAQRFVYLLKTDVRKALTEYFNYQCPFSVKLTAFGPTLGTNGQSSGNWVSTNINVSKVSASFNPQLNNKITDTMSVKFSIRVTPGYWQNLPPNQIIFHIPTAPGGPTGSAVPTSLTSTNAPTGMGNEAIALAAYVDSGSNYLFSCC